MKGLFAGTFWGIVVAGLAVVIGSVSATQPAGNAPPVAPLTQAPAATAPATGTDGFAIAQVPGSETDTPPRQGAAPLGEGATEVAPEAETAAAPQPAASSVTELPAPEAGTPVPATPATDEATPRAAPAVVAAATPEAAPETPQADAVPQPAIGSVEDTLAAPAPGTAPTVPEALPVEETALVTPQSVAAPENVVTAPDPASDPPPQPGAASVDGAPAAPRPGDAPVLSASAEQPVLPNPQGLPPQVPESEADLLVSTTAPVRAPRVPDAPVIVVEDAALPEGAATPPEAPVAADPLESPAAPEGFDASTAPAEPQPEPDEDAPPVVVSIIDTDTDAPQLPGGDSGVTIRRIGVDPAPDPASGEEAEADIPAVDTDAPAIARYAAVAPDAGDKPLMAMILLDDGSLPDAPRLLAEVPFPVTVVLDASAPDAAARMAAYRERGIEVAVQARLPAGARPSDVEVAFEAAFATLPETVLLFDGGDGGLQEDREVTQQAISALADRGRGLVTVPRGFNTALQLAADAGVPAATIFRDLDAEGQDARVIRRFLDQAAFRARQNEEVLLLGRVRPDTVSALILWGTANRAGQVAMVPATAILLDE